MFNEFKKNLDLTKREQLVRVLVQTTYGLRKMITNHKIVNVVFVGDRDEFFIIDPNKLRKYFNLNIGDRSYVLFAQCMENDNVIKSC